MYVIYSTLSTNMSYCFYRKGGADIQILEKTIFIKGGAGVANSEGKTPVAGVTTLNDDTYMQLKENAVFKMHVKNGFIVAQQQKESKEKVAARMNQRDKSAPETPASIEETRRRLKAQNAANAAQAKDEDTDDIPPE